MPVLHHESSTKHKGPVYDCRFTFYMVPADRLLYSIQVPVLHHESSIKHKGPVYDCRFTFYMVPADRLLYSIQVPVIHHESSTNVLFMIVILPFMWSLCSTCMSDTLDYIIYIHNVILLCFCLLQLKNSKSTDNKNEVVVAFRYIFLQFSVSCSLQNALCFLRVGALEISHYY